VRYPKECILKESKEAIIRPLEPDDMDLLKEFYSRVPKEDRWFMRYDIMDLNILQRWMDALGEKKVIAIIAICNEKIVGHGSVHLRDFGCSKHVGRFSIIVLPEFRNKRLGTWLLLDIIQLAMDKGLEELRTDLVVGIEDPAIEAVRKFDFFKRAELPNYMKDIHGNRHNMVIMIKRLHRSLGDF